MQYAIIENNTIINIAIAEEPLADNWIIKPEGAGIGWTRASKTKPWKPPQAAAEAVPELVSVAQCRLALFDLEGIETDEQFFSLVNVLPEEDRPRALLELRTRPTVERNHPLVMAAGALMGWDLDAMFIYAANQ